MIAKEALRLLAWGGAGLIGLMMEGAGGLGFVSQAVTLPLWALMLIFALPMEAVVSLAMRYARRPVREVEGATDDDR